MGFPVVKVSTVEQNGKVVLNLEQERFVADGSKDESAPVWHIPISIASSSSPDKPVTKILLTKKSESFTLDNVKPGEWIKLNAGFTGFYKVRYSDEMLKQLLAPISKKVLKAHDRLNICGDAFALVRAGQVSATSFLDLLESYADETDFTVWSEIDASIDALGNCLERTDYYEKYQKFIRKVYEKIGGQLGWDPKPDEGHTVSMLRPLALGRLGKSGDQQVIDAARKRFSSYVDEGKDLVPDLRGMVFGLVGKYDGEKAQETLMKIFEKSDFSEVQRQCLTALAKSSDVKLQQKSLEYAFSDKVRLQDSYMVVAGLTSSVSGQETAWDYFKKNMETMIEKFGSPTSGLFTSVLKMAARYHCTEEKAKDVEEYFKSKKDLSAALNRPIQQSLENVYLNVGILKRDREAIKAWLIKKGY
jgi:puromycin-sensitive aminopeptidase